METASGPFLRIESGGEAILVLSGELDLASAPLLDAAISELMHATARDLQVGCAGMEFIDSSGLAALERASRALEADGRSLTLVAVPGRFRRLFELCALEQSVAVQFARDESRSLGPSPSSVRAAPLSV